VNNHNDVLLKKVQNDFKSKIDFKLGIKEGEEIKLDYTSIISVAYDMLAKAHSSDDLLQLLKLSNSLPSAELKYKVLTKVLQKAYTNSSDFDYYNIAKLLYDDYIIYHTKENLQFVYSIICESEKMWKQARAKDKYYDYELFASCKISRFKSMIEKKIEK